MKSLSKAQARHIWLRAQRLDTAAPFGEGPQAVASAVEHLGYVQIDTISVIERSHHHILWTRIPEYRRGGLRPAPSGGRNVVEYWAPAPSYVPTRGKPLVISAMRRPPRQGRKRPSSVTPYGVHK